MEQGSQGGFVFEWREGYRTGIDTIDEEHRRLFALVRRLAPANVKAVMDELVEYVVTHFTNEQALMERCGYPAFQEHLELHEQLAGLVSGFLVAGTHWSEERVQALRSFLNKWLVGHILTHDLAFGRWYQARVHGPATLPASLDEDPRPSLFGRLFGNG